MFFKSLTTCYKYNRKFNHKNSNLFRKSSTIMDQDPKTEVAVEKLHKTKILESNTVSHSKTPYTVVTEGKAEILFPSTHDVFYNPVQEFNRDISIAAIKEYFKSGWTHKRLNNANFVEEVKKQLKREQFNNKSEKYKILEALAASGLRSIRYAKEIEDDCSFTIIANDVSVQAVESIKRNVAHNKVENIVSGSQCDASLLMYQHRKFGEQFQVVDIDPYGSPSPFLDAAVQCVNDGGLLMVTCTDMAVLCGNSSETCHAKYGAVSLKSKCCHEMALRITLQCIESHCNRYGRYIIPFLSISVDFYIRIFVQVWTSPKVVKQSASKLSMVYQCSDCETFHFQPLGKCEKRKEGQFAYSNASGPPVGSNCDHCGGVHKIAGPIWTGPIHNKVFVRDLIKSVEQDLNMFKTGRRIIGILNLVYEELDNTPLHFELDRLCAVAHVQMPSLVKFRSAILNAGFQVSMSHSAKNSIKTNAPATLIWDIVRKLCENKDGKKIKEGSTATRILNQALTYDISFQEHSEANPLSRQNHLLRFQLNPEKYWGPKMRSQTSLWFDKPIEKQLAKQGKHKHSVSLVDDTKLLPCKKFKKGKCEQGDDCKFSHT